MVVAEITRDHLYERWNREGGEYNNINHAHTEIDLSLIDDAPEVDPDMGKTIFKLYDDDGELYYSGWLYDDSEGIVQFHVLEWARYDSGCTTIKVKRNGEWVQDIG